jgi:hypothetical protein
MTSQTGPKAARRGTGMQSERAAGLDSQSRKRNETALHGSISEATFSLKQKGSECTRHRCSEIDLLSIGVLEFSLMRSFFYINNTDHYIEQVQYLKSKHKE